MLYRDKVTALGMNGYTVSAEPPAAWQALCINNLFHSLAWQTFLQEAFGAHTAYAWDHHAQTGQAITIFRSGPFRIGYVGFPVGGTIQERALTLDEVTGLRMALRCHGVHLLKLPVSAFARPVKLPLPRAETVETAIENLLSWRPESLPSSVRRNIKKTNRYNVKVAEACCPSQGDTLYRLYRDTVTRHQGALRYNAPYFRGLIQLAKEDLRLRCLLAVYDEKIIGFLVLALSGSTAYYLHGATDMTCQHYRPADLLFHEAITWARDAGIQSFNMMASPLQQQSLIRYKEKWGCTSKPQYTYDLVISPIQAWMFNLILDTHARVRSLISLSKKLTLTFPYLRKQSMK
jgi:hypothetical protein